MKKTKKNVAVAAMVLGTVMIPAFGTAASAATSASEVGFGIHAESKATPELKAQVGEAVDEVIYTVSSGPVSIEITDAMIERSQANWAAFASGDYAAMEADSDGLTIIVDKATGQAISADVAPTAGIRGFSTAPGILIDSTSGPGGASSIGDWRNLESAALGTVVAHSTGGGIEGESKIVEHNGVKIIEGRAQTAAGDSLNRYTLDSPFVPFESL